MVKKIKKRNTAAGTGTPVNLADTSASFHILGLDLFQETSESLRTLHKPKGPRSVVKGCASSNTLQTLRNENPTGGRKTRERNVLHPFVVCRLVQASCLLGPMREFT